MTEPIVSGWQSAALELQLKIDAAAAEAFDRDMDFMVEATTHFTPSPFEIRDLFAPVTIYAERRAKAIPRGHDEGREWIYYRRPDDWAGLEDWKRRHGQ